MLIDGSTSSRFAPVADTFRRQLSRTPGGGAVAVYHEGEKVVDLWGGARDHNGTPWQSDTLAVSFSTTKGVIATLLHQLAEQDLVHYDAPVARYWPEFAAQGKEAITVRDILTHRAGLYGLRHLKLTFDDLLDWDRVCQALADSPADHSKAPYSVYHALTFGWLVGEIIRRVAGQSIPELVQQQLAQPLGLDGLYIGVPDCEHHRVAELLMGRMPGAPRPPKTLGRKLKDRVRKGMEHSLTKLAHYGMAPDFSPFQEAVWVKGFHPRKLTTPEALRAAMPSVNGVFTARALARLYAALANDGSVGDVRILQQRTIPVISTLEVSELDRALFTPMRWRLGYHQPFVLRHRRPRQAFGHFGFGGSGAWADPARNLSVALTVNAGTGTPWGDLRILRVGASALRCAGRK